jgi:hypothetical protein
MKKIFFLSIFILALGRSAFAQDGLPKPTIYGITDTVLSIAQLQDSVAHASDMHFVVVKGAIVQGFTLVYTPVHGAPYIDNVKGRSIDGEIKYRIKSAAPGDKIAITNVKILYLKQDSEIRTGVMYTLQ